MASKGIMISVVGLSTAAILSSCGEQAETPPPIDLSEASVTPSPTPLPNYDLEEDGTYFYIAAVSDKEREEGKATGSVIGYRYYGKNDKDEHVLALVADDGSVLQKSTCGVPCIIIKRDNGSKVAFSSESVIGAAFSDAIAGRLSVHSSEARRAETDENSSQYPRFASSIPTQFRGSWDEIIEDGCESREPRFYLDATKFYNFEVEWDVTNVKLYSATEMDLHTSTMDEGTQVDEIWEFKLVDGGKTLTGRKAGATHFRRCPAS